MSPQALIREAQASGVALRLVGGKVRAIGPGEDVARLLDRLREHRAALADVLRGKQTQKLRKPLADESLPSAEWHSLDVAYQAHHFGCPFCIAAGRNGGAGRRCVLGTSLWLAYSSVR